MPTSTFDDSIASRRPPRVYVLVAIVKKELRSQQSLADISQILSLALFEKIPLFKALHHQNQPFSETPDPNQFD